MRCGVIVLGMFSFSSGALAQPSTALPARLHPFELSASNRGILASAGSRLQLAGQERLVLTGTLTWGTGASMQVNVTTQWPNQFRLDPASGSAVVFTNSAIQKNGTVLPQEESLVNTMVFDSVDNYLLGQTMGAAARTFGPTRMPGSTPAAPDICLPVYVLDRVVSQGLMIPQIKEFAFNAATRLLETVKYTMQTPSGTTAVQSHFSNWKTIQGSVIPFTITRIENGNTVLTLQITSAAIVAAADGTFSIP